jgi:cytochrome c biogenesis protein CcmG/thiol:disulfide interchange protein DsbE
MAGINRRVLVVGAVVALPLVGLLLVSLGRNPQRIDSPLVGMPAPFFRLVPAGGGAPVSLDQLRGRPVVLNFWATWCGPCFDEHPVLLDGARRHAGRAQFLGAIYDDEEAPIVAFLKQHGSAYPTLVDGGGRTAIAYGVYGVPETFFISPTGTITDKYVGPLTSEKLDELLARAGEGAAR